MKKSVDLWQLMGFAITSLGGTLLHFLYDWLDKAKWIAPFSGVNESTWEHMKLIFWPMLIYAIIQSRYFKDNKSFWCVKLKGIMLGMVLIPIIFYTYNGVIGKSPDWLNISFFFISAAAAFLLEAHLLGHCSHRCRLSSVCLFAILAIGALFIIFTFMPPRIPLFQDPITGGYGI